MGCPLNKKKFLGVISYLGDHDFKIVRIGVFMRFDYDFQVTYKCMHCGEMYKKSFVKMSYLISKGFDRDKLEAIRQSYFGEYIDESVYKKPHQK